ncbi:amino acid permease C-terminal domain-containing protein [Micromonospora purpureochromogenes]|uniref:amino acid permease C-terminal domain-containing protein n=1 Tax=Micromonospora purpureochromogenes TaxID=47872 RepID=UPI003333814D
MTVSTRAVKVPFSPVPPIVPALACLYLMLNLSVETWIRFGIWMLLGAAIHFGHGHRPPPTPHPHEGPPSRKEWLSEAG